jgi:hypothetical protein
VAAANCSARLRAPTPQCPRLPAPLRPPPTQSIVLASTFAVSHNVPETKPLDKGTQARENLDQTMLERDWGVQQVRARHERGVAGCMLSVP